jgi:hypothetical protein
MKIMISKLGKMATFFTIAIPQASLSTPSNVQKTSRESLFAQGGKGPELGNPKW